jgi:hypothetical protein
MSKISPSWSTAPLCPRAVRNSQPPVLDDIGRIYRDPPEDATVFSADRDHEGKGSS